MRIPAIFFHRQSAASDTGKFVPLPDRGDLSRDLVGRPFARGVATSESKKLRVPASSERSGRRSRAMGACLTIGRSSERIRHGLGPSMRRKRGGPRPLRPSMEASLAT